MAARYTNYRLLSDEPAYEFTRKDELRFAPTAEVLAGAALQAESPITIGIFGNWGTGKTSLMRLMKEMVAKRGRIADDPKDGQEAVSTTTRRIQHAAVPVWFNAWQYEREEHLIIPLIATISRELDAARKEWEKIRLDDKVDEAARKALEKLKRGGQGLYDRLRAAL